MFVDDNIRKLRTTSSLQAKVNMTMFLPRAIAAWVICLFHVEFHRASVVVTGVLFVSIAFPVGKSDYSRQPAGREIRS